MAEDESPGAFYLPLGDGRFRATEATASPWDEKAQHGGPPAALLATVCADLAATPDLRVARFAVDMLGPIPRGDVRVTASVLRPGRRIQLVEAALEANGRTAAVGRAWLINARARPPATPGTAEDAVPELPGPAEQRFFPGIERWGYGEAVEWRFAGGGYDRLGPAEVWTRVRIPLIEGNPLTGLQRLLITADAANGVSAELPLDDWLFIPPSLTVTVHRFPAGAWTFLRARTWIGADGVGMTHGRLGDPDGTTGFVEQPLLVEPRAGPETTP
ncbi:thioesterase family protein [Amycolatopsis anabasis]|uniref:thioesterase family protein n=1 Tax=Amycolatopsis anabasis TaxID=1840409 RepID=UPI00131CF820|nr:thioesterase family protein [Amycolatopsis anabasis]